MNKEMLKILDDLSKKPTTELALQIMELSIENLILKQQCRKQKEAIDKAIEFSNKNWGTWCSNHPGYMTELQNILKEVSE